mgnify:CR=1 FL=1
MFGFITINYGQSFSATNKGMADLIPNFLLHRQQQMVYLREMDYLATQQKQKTYQYQYTCRFVLFPHYKIGFVK